MSKVIGDHLLCEANTLVFQHVYGGVTYVVAVRINDRTIVNYLQLTGANATTCILAAINALTAGRTWIELVVVKGYYSDCGQILLPSYTELYVLGRLDAVQNLNTNFIQNSDLVSGNTRIKITGGTFDTNPNNVVDYHTADINTIYFENVTESEVCFCYVSGAIRVTTNGEGIKLQDSERCWVHHNFLYRKIQQYDMIKLTGASVLNIIANNICDSLNYVQPGGASWAIQLAELTCLDNIVADNIVLSPSSGIKMHNASRNDIIGNYLYVGSTAAIQEGIGLVDSASSNLIIGNKIQLFGTAGSPKGIAIRQATGGTNADDNFLIGNYIKLPNVAGSVGISVGLHGRRTRIHENIVLGGTAADTGIEIVAGATTTFIFDNDLTDPNLDTKLVDAGTDTRLPSIIVAFVGGAEHIVADGAPKGWRVDASGEYAIAYVVMPHDCARSVRIKVWGVGLAAPGAGNEMLLRIDFNSGLSDEPWNSETGSVTNKPSNETNFAINDVVSWTLTSADDPDVDDFLAGECVEVKVIYNAAVAPDIATNALLRCVQIEYV